MENAAEALKIGFGVLVFAMALTVLFNMSSLLKSTSDDIFKSIDETNLYDYTVNPDNIENGKRKVIFNDIIPTIYRYAQEGYGVTIMDNSGNIVARFDLDTEINLSDCFWDYNSSSRGSNNQRENSNKIKSKLSLYIKQNIFDVIGEDIPELNNNLNNYYDSPGEGYDNFSWLNKLIGNIYSTGNTGTNLVYTGWTSANTYTNNQITQRISCDIYGKKDNQTDNTSGITYFNGVYTGISDPTTFHEYGHQHKAVCNGNGLLTTYNGNTFIEYITEIDNENEYSIDINGNETDLFRFGTTRYTKKREIIYVLET